MDINQWVYTLSQNAYDEYVKLKEDRLENDFIGTIDESTKSAGNNNPIIIDSSGAVIRNKVDLASYTYKDETGRLKTNYLINNDVLSSSSKNKKAKELGVPIISEDDFLKL